MANVKNLIPQAHILTVEEQSKAGKASVESRRRRKAIAETLNILMAQKVKEKNAKKKLKEIGVAEEDQDMQMLLMVSEFNRALSGNESSRDFIMKMMGETNADSDGTGITNNGVVIVDDCEFIDEEDIIEEEPSE